VVRHARDLARRPDPAARHLAVQRHPGRLARAADRDLRLGGGGRRAPQPAPQRRAARAERHAPSATVQVHLGSDDEAIRFTIHDDGPGFELSTTDAGEGMQIMRDRIAALSGELVIESTLGRGTTVTGRVPARVMEASPA
jgi:hypothetical protein